MITKKVGILKEKIGVTPSVAAPAVTHSNATERRFSKL